MGLFGNLPKSYGFPIYSGSGSVVPFEEVEDWQDLPNTSGVDVKYQNIIMMDEYSDTSQEELRYADYLLGRQNGASKSKPSLTNPVETITVFSQPTLPNEKKDEESDSESDTPRPIKRRKLELTSGLTISSHSDRKVHEKRELTFRKGSVAKLLAKTNANPKTQPKLTYNPGQSGIILTKPKIFIRPNLFYLDCLTSGDTCLAMDVVIGHHDFGYILFMGVTDLYNANLDQIFEFTAKGVKVYPNETKTPALGQGFNKPATVTLFNVWPVDEITQRKIMDINDELATKFADELVSTTEKNNGKFISYDKVIGKFVFSVDEVRAISSCYFRSAN